jgi:hypothetical protein
VDQGEDNFTAVVCKILGNSMPQCRKLRGINFMSYLDEKWEGLRLCMGKENCHYIVVMIMIIIIINFCR